MFSIELDDRHVILPKEMLKSINKGQMLQESEWRSIGVQQSRGWVHYACHRYYVDLPISGQFHVSFYSGLSLTFSSFGGHLELIQ